MFSLLRPHSVQVNSAAGAAHLCCSSCPGCASQTGLKPPKSRCGPGLRLGGDAARWSSRRRPAGGAGSGGGRTPAGNGPVQGRLGSERSARLTTESVRAPVGPGRTGRLPNLKVEEELGVPLLSELCTHEARDEACGEIHWGFPGEDLAVGQSLDVPSPMAFGVRNAPRHGGL